MTGRKADVVLAAYNALEVALRLAKPNNKNTEVTEAIQKIAETYNCKPIQNMLSYNVSRFRIEGDKSIILNPTDRTTHSECSIWINEVWAIDVLVSTGSGKTKESTERPTVYVRSTADYSTKLKASAEFMVQADSYITFPFTLRDFPSEARARLALNECVAHNVFQPFTTLVEKDGTEACKPVYAALI